MVSFLSKNRIFLTILLLLNPLFCSPQEIDKINNVIEKLLKYYKTIPRDSIRKMKTYERKYYKNYWPKFVKYFHEQNSQKIEKLNSKFRNNENLCSWMTTNRNVITSIHEFLYISITQPADAENQKGEKYKKISWLLNDSYKKFYLLDGTSDKLKANYYKNFYGVDSLIYEELFQNSGITYENRDTTKIPLYNKEIYIDMLRIELQDIYQSINSREKIDLLTATNRYEKKFVKNVLQEILSLELNYKIYSPEEYRDRTNAIYVSWFNNKWLRSKDWESGRKDNLENILLFFLYLNREFRRENTSHIETACDFLKKSNTSYLQAKDTNQLKELGINSIWVYSVNKKICSTPKDSCNNINFQHIEIYPNNIEFFEKADSFVILFQFENTKENNENENINMKIINEKNILVDSTLIEMAHGEIYKIPTVLPIENKSPLVSIIISSTSSSYKEVHNYSIIFNNKICELKKID